jgi:hypothetical protein
MTERVLLLVLKKIIIAEAKNGADAKLKETPLGEYGPI